ncbi:MAG: hypothetical protein ACTFAK_11305 [Candidatus Electronema sp. VV]
MQLPSFLDGSRPFLLWFSTSFVLALLFGLITDANCGMRFLFYHSLLYFPVVAIFRRWYGIKSKSRCSAVINFLRDRLHLCSKILRRPQQ